jgi:hypothetical protein
MGIAQIGEGAGSLARGNSKDKEDPPGVSVIPVGTPLDFHACVRRTHPAAMLGVIARMLSSARRAARTHGWTAVLAVAGI